MGLKFLLYFIGMSLENFFKMRMQGSVSYKQTVLMHVRSNDSESHESDIESRVLSLGC